MCIELRRRHTVYKLNVNIDNCTEDGEERRGEGVLRTAMRSRVAVMAHDGHDAQRHGKEEQQKHAVQHGHYVLEV